VSNLLALTIIAIKPTGRVFVSPGVFYLVDTGNGDVTFLLPPSSSCQPGDRVKIKKISPDSHAVQVTPWNTENINGSNTPAVINTSPTSHDYIPLCPAAYGGAVGWISW
jgi:hypothetical protein